MFCNTLEFLMSFNLEIQEWLVDIYATLEGQRLQWVRFNQG